MSIERKTGEKQQCVALYNVHQHLTLGIMLLDCHRNHCQILLLRRKYFTAPSDPVHKMLPPGVHVASVRPTDARYPSCDADPKGWFKKVFREYNFHSFTMQSASKLSAAAVC